MDDFLSESITEAERGEERNKRKKKELNRYRELRSRILLR